MVFSTEKHVPPNTAIRMSSMTIFRLQKPITDFLRKFHFHRGIAAIAAGEVPRRGGNSTERTISHNASLVGLTNRRTERRSLQAVVVHFIPPLEDGTIFYGWRKLKP